MSDITEKKENEKLSPDDTSLAIPRGPKLNKKVMKAIFIGFCTIVLLALIIAFSPQEKKTGGKKEEERRFSSQSPHFLSISDDDYAEKVNETEERGLTPSEIAEQLSSGNDPQAADDRSTGGPLYTVYDRREEREQAVVEKKADSSRLFEKTRFSGAQQVSQKDEELAVRKSAIFFQIKQPASSPDNDRDPLESNAQKQLDVLERQVEAQMITDYQKQNQQKDKEEWISERKSDYSEYLDELYLEPFSTPNEIKAGTIIPITMVTAICSDLPGEIIAQVVVDVYDSISGLSLLIPKGTKVIGSYDSSVAWGQKRVLLCWNRIIRPDGVSLNLKGMQGSDLRGMSGLKDRVDNHLDEIIPSLALSTVFDLSLSAAAEWMSSNGFLSSLSRNIGGKAETAGELNKKVFEKLINQQPTITIREGTRGNIIVSKDIILPKYDDWEVF